MLGSPVYGHLAGRLAEDPRPARAILGDEASWDLGLRLFGAVHYLVLTGVAPTALSGEWDDFAAALADARGARSRGSCASRACRRTRPSAASRSCRRSSPSPRASGLPLDLIELGPSAGLNLVFDRYGYRYAEGTFGAPDARLRFDAVERGRVPAALLETPIEVHSRVGIDLSPIDVTDPDDVVLLKSFIWPGLDERVAAPRRCDRDVPRDPEPADPDPGRLRRPASRPARRASRGAAHGRLPDGLDRLPHARALRRAPPVARAARRRTAGRWRSSRRAAMTRRETEIEEGFELAIRVWPDAERLAAFVDFHGNWVDWLDGMISSKDNPKLKLVRALQRKKERDETGPLRLRGRGSLRRGARGGHRARSSS